MPWILLFPLYFIVGELFLQLFNIPNPGLVLDEIGIWLLLLSIIILIEQKKFTLLGVIYSINFTVTLLLLLMFINRFYMPISIVSGDWLGSAFGFRNQLVLFLLQALPLGVYLLLLSRSFFIRLWTSLNIILSLVCIVLFRCRSGWVILAFYFAMFVLIPSLRKLFYRQKHRRGICFIGISTVLLAFSLKDFLHWNSASPYTNSLTSIFNPSAWSGRLLIWQKTLQFFYESPLTGIGAKQLVIRLSDLSLDSSFGILKGSFNVVMNEYLRYFVELGIIGGLAYLTFFLITPVAILLRWKKLTTKKALLLLSLFAVSIQAFSEPISSRLISLIIYCLIFTFLVEKKFNIASQARWYVAKATGVVFICLCFYQMPLRILALNQISKLDKNPYETYEVKTYWDWTNVKVTEQLHQFLNLNKTSEAQSLVEQQKRYFPKQYSTYEISAVHASRTGDSAEANQQFTTLLNSSKECSQQLIRQIEIFASFYALSYETKNSLKNYLVQCPHLFFDDAVIPIEWKKSQSKVINWYGKVLFAQTDQNGLMRPKVYYKNEIFPLQIPASLDFSNSHLMVIDALSEQHVLLLSVSTQAQSNNLYVYNKATTELTKINKGNSDTGKICLNSHSRKISFEENGSRVITYLGSSMDRQLDSTVAIESFDLCAINNQGVFAGIKSARTNPIVIICNGNDHKNDCTENNLKNLTDAREIFTLPDGTFGLTGRGITDDRVGSFSINLQETGVIELTATAREQEDFDLLDTNQDFKRFADRSFYWIETSKYKSDKNIIVYSAVKVDQDIYGIISDSTHPRTLGRLGNDSTWEFLVDRPVHQQIAINAVEIPTDSKSETIPAWLFGDPSLKKLIVWWHGGPNENVSPRYNPYFHLLNNLGYRVLAVNYPGSIGYGKKFEKSINREALASTIKAVKKYATHNNYQKIVSYSVSYGNKIQKILLEEGIAVDAIIDQVGNDKGALQALAESKKIPILTVRGQYDPAYTKPHTVSYLYQGGHDIEDLKSFETLAWKLSLFLP